MKTKIFISIVTALLIQCSLFAQTEKLPVIKANSNQAQIQEDNCSSYIIWTILPEVELDVLKTSAKEITFYTDLDSISFTIDPKVKKEYDFIILLNEKDSARTQVRYEKQRDIKESFSNSFDFFTTISTNKPENFDPRAVNQGFRHSFSYRMPFGKSKFSLSMGVGIGFYNYYIDALPKEVLPASMQLGDSYFRKIATISEPEISYKKNKMNLTYLDIPLELKYGKKDGFKVSAGAKIDFLVNSYLKFKGSDFIFGSNEDIKMKKYNLDHLSKLQFGPIVRVGWKRINVYASYSFTPVYDADAGSKLNPVCVGISITPLY